jgi:hypothetical protein
LTNDWQALHSIQTPQLQNNLQYIQTMLPELLQLLQRPLPAEALLVRMENGKVLCRSAGTPPLWVFGEKGTPEEIEAIRAEMQQIPPQTSLLILMGTALGYALAQALPLLFHHPQLHILALESSLTRLRAPLAFIDLRKALVTGRLHVGISDGSLVQTVHYLELYNLWQQQDVHIYYPPGILKRFAVDEVVRNQQEKQQQIERKKQKILLQQSTRHAQTGGRKVERVLLLDCWQNTPGQAHIQAIQKALEARHIKTWYHPLQRYRFDAHPWSYRRLIEPQLLGILDPFQPDMLLSYGYHGHHFLPPSFFEKLNLLLLQVVSNIAFFDTEYSTYENTAVCDRLMIPHFQRRGSKNTFFVPLMADYTAPEPVVTSRQLPLVFVGNSLGLSSQAEQEYYSRYQNRPRLLQYLRQAQQDFASYNPEMNLYSYLDAHPIPEIENVREEYEVFRFLLCQGSAARRIQLLESIAHLGLVLYGGDWSYTLPQNSPLRACLKGYLSMHQEHKIFSAGHVFVNIHSIGHVTGPNMRFFNVSGMGAFQISDGAFGHFLQPDKECVYYNSVEEFREKVEYYLHHPQAADPIRQQALKRVHRDWTYDNWLDWVFRELKIE